MSISLEVALTILGGIITVVGVVFSFGYKFSKYDTQIKKNTADIDGLGSLLHEEKRKVEGLQRDTMQLTSDILRKFGDEVKPIRESIQLLTERVIKNHADITHFRTDVGDIKTMMGDIKTEISTRPCINHNFHQ